MKNKTITKISHREPTVIYAKKELRDQNLEHFFDIANINNVIIDLSLTHFIDTASLSALLQTKTALEVHGFKLTLVNPQASIRTLLYVTKIYHLIPSFSQHLQAMTFLQQELQEQQS